MSEYSAAQRAAILQKSRELLARGTPAYTPADDEVRYRRYDPEPEPEPEPRRRRERMPAPKLDTMPAPNSAADWSGWEAWLSARLEAEREAMLAAVVEIVGESLGNAISDAIGHERDQAQRNLRELRAETSKLSSTVDELYGLLAADRSKIIDMPNPLPRRGDLN